jgi:hypothetical protein
MHTVNLTQEELDYIIFVIKGDLEVLAHSDDDEDVPVAEKVLAIFEPLSTQLGKSNE